MAQDEPSSSSVAQTFEKVGHPWRVWLTLGLKEVGKDAVSRWEVCKEFVAIFNLLQVRRLRPRKRMGPMHDHRSYKGQEGGQSRVFWHQSRVVLSLSTQPLLERKAENCVPREE